MNVVNVKLMLQFDHFSDEGEVTREMVKTYVELINTTLGQMHNNSQPQLFFNQDEDDVIVVDWQDDEED